ncbi:hypothetical protein E6H20_11090 [Candidatus Bathyarchaeota archaeon]|nr:MAG: hypothetical protein E6H20_11090 [Candidatus Bathyarchaeota archaeon]
MRSVPVILVLCLTALMLIPSTIPRVGAVLSNGNNYWSAYGPNVDNLVYKVYNDYNGLLIVGRQTEPLERLRWSRLAPARVLVVLQARSS